MAQSGGLGPTAGSGFCWIKWRTGDDRFNLHVRPPKRCDGQKGGSCDRGMGRSRGGLTSKLHALVDADGRPVSLRLTGGQVHDACEAEALIEAIPEGPPCWATKDMTARPSVRPLQSRTSGPTFPIDPTATSAMPSRHGSTNSATSSSASSTASSSSVASQRATTRIPRTSSPPSSSSAFASGAPHNEPTR